MLSRSKRYSLINMLLPTTHDACLLCVVGSLGTGLVQILAGLTNL